MLEKVRTSWAKHPFLWVTIAIVKLLLVAEFALHKFAPLIPEDTIFDDDFKRLSADFRRHHNVNSQHRTKTHPDIRVGWDEEAYHSSSRSLSPDAVSTKHSTNSTTNPTTATGSLLDEFAVSAHSPRVLVHILTTPKYYDTRIKAITETWARHVPPGMLMVSTTTTAAHGSHDKLPTLLAATNRNQFIYYNTSSYDPHSFSGVQGISDPHHHIHNHHSENFKLKKTFRIIIKKTSGVRIEIHAFHSKFIQN